MSMNSDIRFSICGLKELHSFVDREVTHVISITNPEYTHESDFRNQVGHHVSEFKFHDIIELTTNLIPPSLADIERLLLVSRDILSSLDGGAHLLVHCHSGISRSTACLAAIFTQTLAGTNQDAVFQMIRQLRPQAWPNSLIMRYADEIMDKKGELLASLGRHYAYQINAYPALPRLMLRASRLAEVEMARASMMIPPKIIDSGS